MMGRCGTLRDGRKEHLEAPKVRALFGVKTRDGFQHNSELMNEQQEPESPIELWLESRVSPPLRQT